MRPEDITFHVKDGVKSSARNEFTRNGSQRFSPWGECKVESQCRDQTDGSDHQRSYEELDLALGKDIGLAFKASAIHVVEKTA